MGTGSGVILGIIAGATATVLVVAALKRGNIIISSLRPLTPPQDNAFQSGVVKMTNVSLIHVNSNVDPALYHAVLSYSDGSINPNAVITITDIENLIQIGVPVFNNLDNPSQIPTNDKIVFGLAASA